MSLQARVTRLEGMIGGEPCGRCGFREHEMMTPFVRISDDTAQKGSPSEISKCPDCGHLLVFTMDFSGNDDD